MPLRPFAMSPIGQRGGQQNLDVVAAQKGMRIDMLDSTLQHELHRHHHQGHMTMPGLPFSGLILRHPNMAFGILEGSLDPEPLCLHLGQFHDARLGRCIAQTVFHGARRIDFSSHDQMPTLCGRALLVPQPHTSMQYLHDHCAFVVRLSVFFRQAAAGCCLSHLRTSMGCARL